jgi:hypothetical protein
MSRTTLGTVKIIADGGADGPANPKFKRHKPGTTSKLIGTNTVSQVLKKPAPQKLNAKSDKNSYMNRLEVPF